MDISTFRRALLAAIGTAGAGYAAACTGSGATQDPVDVALPHPGSSDDELATATRRPPRALVGWVREESGRIHRASVTACSAERAPPCRGDEERTICRNHDDCPTEKSRCVSQTDAS